MSSVFRVPDLLYVPPDFYDDKWRRCHWCWKWGMCLWPHPLTPAHTHDVEVWPPVLPDGVLQLTRYTPSGCIDCVGYLCDTCYDLEEPPWYPNARQRCAQSSEHIMPHSLRGNPTVLATISAFVVWNDPWRFLDARFRAEHPAKHKAKAALRQ